MFNPCLRILRDSTHFQAESQSSEHNRCVGRVTWFKCGISNGHTQSRGEQIKLIYWRIQAFFAVPAAAFWSFFTSFLMILFLCRDENKKQVSVWLNRPKPALKLIKLDWIANWETHHFLRLHDLVAVEVGHFGPLENDAGWWVTQTKRFVFQLNIWFANLPKTTARAQPTFCLASIFLAQLLASHFWLISAFSHARLTNFWRALWTQGKGDFRV